MTLASFFNLSDSVTSNIVRCSAAVAFSVAAFAANAEMLSLNEALQRLADENPAMVKARGMNLRNAELVQASDYTYMVKNGEVMLLLSADDAAPALLGYFDNAAAQNDDNEAFKEWLKEYNNQISYLVENNITSAPRRSSRMAVEPIVKTSWSQGFPFNSECPSFNGQNTLTGCVALTMAQIMHSQQWPAVANGSVSYYWNAGQMGMQFDFSASSFNYNTMTLGYPVDGSANTGGASELIKACAMSAKSQFGVSATSATGRDMCLAMINNFSYDQSIWRPARKHYSEAEWEEMIFNSLAEGVAVPLSGCGNGGGHQFIVDGCDSNGLFHINWGWGGSYNGYFLLSALDAAGYSFNLNQEAALNVKPAQSGSAKVYNMVTDSELVCKTTIANPGQMIEFTGEFINNSLWNLPDNNYQGLEFTNLADGTKTYSRGATAGRLGYRYYINSWKATLPALADGMYIMTPALQVEGNWSEVRAPYNGRTHYMIEVSAGVARIIDPSEVTPVVSSDIDFSDSSEVEMIGASAEAEVRYDLQGRRVQNSKGLQISNGRLIMVR